MCTESAQAHFVINAAFAHFAISLALSFFIGLFFLSYQHESRNLWFVFFFHIVFYRSGVHYHLNSPSCCLLLLLRIHVRKCCFLINDLKQLNFYMQIRIWRNEGQRALNLNLSLHKYLIEKLVINQECCSMLLIINWFYTCEPKCPVSVLRLFTHLIDFTIIHFYYF